MNDVSGRAERGLPAEEQALAARLAAMFRADDPPPADAVELARQSFTLRTVDAELAALVEDSEARIHDRDRRPLVVRAADAARGPRLLTYHFYDGQSRAELVIAMQVEMAGTVRRLTGHLTPPGPARIELRQAAVPQARRVDADPLGRFLIEDVLPGPTSLTCQREGTPPVVTEWTFL
ncbi:MAG TPA: hypothetical protein VI011_00500 [Asanoa sp.]